MSTNPNDKKPTSPEDPDEVAHLDDAVIGRAFRWSAVAFVVIALGVAGTIIFLKRKPATAPVQQTKLTAPVVSESAPAEIPAARFTDITAAAGITFVHNNGAYGDKLLPETMGGGAAFFDFDNDGAPDLLFVNSTTWPWKTVDQKPTMALYRNDGKGHFENVTAGSGLDVSFYGMGAAIGDYDNDGWQDVFITGVGGNHLFHNNGNGKFTETTISAGVAGLTTGWSTVLATTANTRAACGRITQASRCSRSRVTPARPGFRPCSSAGTD